MTIFIIFFNEKFCYKVDFQDTSVVSFDAYFHKFINNLPKSDSVIPW
jgi:hypothetical protein